ncbi:AAA family ATPase [Acidicapsa ligni]|uniref:AAA family ATPase n=1 Tax=Acidicapsa ligni TaxID=542300 RepID=UPI0021E04AAA|nr:AAA family ATPase [Acidicapsa ligni]
MDGWNGHICTKPSSNRFCIGPHSYPGEKINESRDLAWEEQVAGKSCSKIDGIPPCIYSINAFGREALTAFDDPPDFFGSGKRTKWHLPPATVCVWPYEAMYDEDAKSDGRVDNAKRLELAKTFFSAIEAEKSIVFHYANYSNPLSTEDNKRYAVVGLARVKRVGRIEFYDDTDGATKEKYAGGFVWQCNIETLYPDQGMRIPYHRYLDRPDVLEKITLIPENVRCFKYGSRHVSDDDALSLVERFIEIAAYLRDIGDDSENWSLRIDWLNSLLGELWQSRGLYPGLARVLDLVGLTVAVSPLRAAVARGEEKKFRDAAFAWLDEETTALSGLPISSSDAAKVRRQWKLKTNDERHLLSDILPRFDLPSDQMDRILSSQREESCVTADLDEIAENPYLLVEQFVGDDPDDVVSFNRIDHGVFPSPDLGGNFLFDTDDWRRLRSLCVDRLRFETKHTFLSCGQMLQDINHRLSVLPDWKTAKFTERYLEIDRKSLEEAVAFRKEGVREYAYLLGVYQAEREIEDRVRKLAQYSDVTFRSPVTERHWRDLLFEAKSPLAAKSRTEYDEAIAMQATVCAKIFSRPLSVVCGAAGTGKTTIIRAILQAIEKAHGAEATFLLLAPTGKAADRIREKTGKPASTIHSFLARRGWLNANLTIKPSGGQREESVTTFVIDEASMLDLELMAALFRAVNWSAVQRLIIVGDPNQLPPIGRGKVFADIIDWLRAHHPSSIGELMVNLRQMENRIGGKGTGILDLASLYVRVADRETKDQEASIRAEEMFQRLQDLPSDGAVDKDLRVLFWKDAPDLMNTLIARMVSDMEQDSGEKLDPVAPHQLWLNAAKTGGQAYRPDYHQVIIPYLHEDFGTEAVNLRVQREARGSSIDRIGALAGITLFDKVIQTRNRGGSDPLRAWNFKTKTNESCEVFNGELGYVTPHGFDAQNKKWQWNGFRLKRFSVQFSRKEFLAVGYGRQLGNYVKNGKTKWIKEEKPEDNLDLAYAISVHKSQGSEFDRIYFILPKQKAALLSPELFYTGITRASKHCTLLIEQDISPLLRIHRPEASHLVGINCSLFDFTPAPDGFELLRREGYMQEGKIHRALADVMVRSKSEVIIANLLFERDIFFEYEKPLYAADGSFYLPDFTVLWRGERYFWEHLGLLVRDEYRKKWAIKKTWYDKHFPGRLVTTEESGNLSIEAKDLIDKYFS